MKKSLVTGTLVLTGASLITRLLGFVYRMLLSNAIGAEGVGLYQLCMSVAGIAMAICAGALTTAVSKYVAQSSRQNSIGYLNAGILITLSLSAALFVILDNFSVPIAKFILIGENNAGLLKIMAIAIPFAGLHGIINGYYYGMQKVSVPAISTLCEQLIRVGVMYGFSFYAKEAGQLNVISAFYSMLAGEMAACIYCIAHLFIADRYRPCLCKITNKIRQLVTFSFPLTVNSLLMHVLQSVEAVLIPAKLQLLGHTRAYALAEYGTLTGMALPFILLPTIITNAISVQLLPMISKADRNHNASLIKRAVLNCIGSCIYLGIFCSGFFSIFGKNLGAIMFQNESLIYFIEVLSFLCPFLFINAMLTSILNGLGYSKSTSCHNIAGIVIRLLCVIFVIPIMDITGYMHGILISQIIVCVLNYNKVRKYTGISEMHIFRYIGKPAFISFISLGISELVFLLLNCFLPDFWCNALASVCAALIFLLMIFKEFKNMFKENY